MALRSGQLGTPNSAVQVNSSGELTDIQRAYANLTDGDNIEIDFSSSLNFKLATSRAAIAITFANANEGDYRDISIVLTGTSLVLTFPANSLCVGSDGTPSGDNTCTLSGTSGDKYRISIGVENDSNYIVLAKNIAQ